MGLPISARALTLRGQSVATDEHVGKSLRGFSRADEHRAVLAEITGIAERGVALSGSAARYGWDDGQLFARDDRRGQAVSVAQVVGTKEQVDVRSGPTLLVADPAFEHRMLERQPVEHHRNRRHPVRANTNGDLDHASAGDETAQLCRNADANVHNDQPTIGAARTDTTGGRCSARTRHESPSSLDA